MDNNVYRILLGSSASGGVDPQIIRTSWTAQELYKYDDSTSIYLGYNESYIGNVISMNAGSASINWARRVYTNPNGSGGFSAIGKIFSSSNLSNLYAQSGDQWGGSGNKVFTISSSTGSVSSSDTLPINPYYINDNYYVSATSYYDTGRNDAYPSTTVYLNNRSNNTGWYSYNLAGRGTQSWVINDLIIHGSYVYLSATWGNDGVPDSYNATHYGRYSLSNGSYTLISATDIGPMKFLGVSSDNNYFYTYIPVGWGSGYAYSGVFTGGRVAKIQISNGSLVWGKHLSWTYSGGYSGAGTKHAIFDPETEDTYVLTHFRVSNNDGGWVPIWKVNSSGNTEFVRQISSNSPPTRIAVDADNMYLLGSNSNYDNGYGPGAIYIFPKDGTLTGTYGATTYSDVTSTYAYSSFSINSKSARGSSNTLGSSTTSSLSSSSNTNGSISNGYVVPVS